jgi:probable HAF family extracellular repeat protein
MRLNWKLAVALSAPFIASLTASTATAADFRGLGFLNTQDNSSRATAVSPDGSTVVGSSSYQFQLEGPDGQMIPWSNGSRPFRWTAEGMAVLGGGSTSGYWDAPSDVANGGQAVLGSSMYIGNPFFVTGTIHLPQPYLWESQVDRSPINLLTDHGYRVYPTDSSADATIWAGSSGDQIQPGTGQEAFRYTAEAGAVGLGFLPGGGPGSPGFLAGYSGATGISADGGVVVGYSASANSLDQPWQGGPLQNDAFSGYEAFVWTESTGVIGLGDLPGGYFDSQANAVSADGRVVVGSGATAQGSEAFRWSSESGMVGLGFLKTDAPGSWALAASRDGSIIVGNSIVERDSAPDPGHGLGPIVTDHFGAFIWDPAHGMRNLQSVLESDYGLDLSGWQLTSAVDISDDGRVIAGNGINPQGQQEAWVVHLHAIPEPATVVMIVLGFGVTLLARRRILKRGDPAGLADN